MPEFNVVESTVFNQYTRTSTSQPWSLSQSNKEAFEPQLRTYPVTVKRKPPADLFLRGTARTTTSTFKTSSKLTAVFSSGRQMNDGRFAVTAFQSAVPSRALLPAADFGAMRNVARKKVRQDAVNLAMALAEYRKTAALYGSLARAVATKGKSLAAAVKQPAGASKAWLGFQYGVKPHVSDILGSVDALSNRCKSPIYISGVESRNEAGIEFAQLKIPYVGSELTHDAFVDFQQKRRLRLQWRATMNPNAVRNVLVRHGFTNPFALAYELIPYSFVLDWWINVGDVLASLDNLLLLDRLTVIESSSNVSARFVNSPGVSRGASSLSGYHWSVISRTDARRSPVDITPISTLEYKPSASLMHILNGLALLRVARRRF